jgi:hypothetical protein
MSTATPPTSTDDFFIGWEPLPASHVRFLRPLCRILFILAGCAAALIALHQRSPGTGQWDSDSVVTLEGIVYARPYAMLHVGGEPPRTFLLVEEGKFGALDRIEKITEGYREGRAVRVRGTVLHRGNRWMLELAEGADGLQPLTPEDSGIQPALPRREMLAGRVTLHGEIIDPKCYLGAMKPGGGKTHKSCASLCIAGGIPPMLVTRGPDRRETFYLLTTSEGGPAGDMVLPFAGDQVEITGRLERQGDVLILAAGAGDIRRR